MSYGFSCRGDDGYIQIDENYKNFALVQSGASQTSTNFGQASFVTINASGLVNPMLAIVQTGGYGVTVTSSTNNNGTWGWVVYGAHAAPVTFNYYIFDNVPGSGGGNYGLIVRDGSGAVTFNSNYKYLRVAGFDGLGYNFPFNPQSGRTYATIWGGCTVKIERTGGTGNTIITTWTGMFTSGSATIQVLSSSQSVTTYPWTYYRLYVDVTNY